MIKNYLILTPIRQSWPKSKKNNLIFLSESAIPGVHGPQINYNRHYINKFIWDDEKIFSKDYKYLVRIYEKFLILFSKKLNLVHKKNYSIRFWRILIGPWLSTFIHIYFERWSNVKETLKKYKIDKCIFVNLDQDLFIPYDQKDFIYMSQTDLWNQFLYQKIIFNFLKNNKIKTIKIGKNAVNKENLNSILNKFHDKKNIEKLKNLITKTFKIFNTKNYEYFLHDTYLGFKNELKLSLRLNQAPIYVENKNNNEIKEKNLGLRENFKNLFIGRNKFEKSLVEILPQSVPKIFLENFEDCESFLENENLPQNPKVVFTSASLWYDTKISYYVAKLTENKTKLIYGQHGGCFGITKHHWPEKHEISIADSFLSWGWKKKNNRKIKRFFILKNLSNTNLKKENLLIPLRARKRYFHSLESSSGTETYSSYINHINSLLENLEKSVIKKTILRLPYNSLKIQDIDFFANLEKNYNFYNKESFEKACNKAKLIVHASNSTTFLETISLNFPTILLINKYNSPIRFECKKTFEILYDNNIVFYDTISASKFINSIWDAKITSWWKNNKTQKAVNMFCDNYARKDNKIVDSCFSFLKNYKL